MSLLERICNIVNIEVEEPVAYGGLHLFCFAVVLVLTVLLCIKLANAGDKAFRAVIIASWVIMFLFEAIKQTFFQLELVDGAVVYQYTWVDFPFQLCSTPIFVLPFLGFLRDGKARDFAAAYIMTVGLIGGLAVYFSPDTVLVTVMVKNVQSMTHHGIQVITGILTAVYYRKRINKTFWLRGLAVFSVMFAIANLLNTVGFNILTSSGIMAEDASFNMFYITPNRDQRFPMFGELFGMVHPLVYIIGYYIAIAGGSALICYATHLCYRLITKRRSAEEAE